MRDSEAQEMLDSIKDELPVETPSEAENGQAQPEAPAAAEPPSWNAQEWEFDWNGKKIAPDSRDKALKWMSQGHNYSQRTAEHNMAVKAWEQQKAALEAKYKGYDRYAQIDEFARSNPEWMEHVNQAFLNRGQQPAAQGQSSPDFRALVEPLQKELQEIKAWRDEQLAEKSRLDQERFDKALSTEIEEIRGQHANIDFDAVDESGQSLESRVLAHAQQIGTSSFRAAFRDYYHDKIMESAKASQLSAQAKAPAVAAKRGILGTSPAPRKVADAPVDHRGRSWDELNELAKAEFLHI